MNKIKEILSNRLVEISLFAALFFILEYEYYDFVNLPLFQNKMGFRFEFVWWKFIFVKLLAGGLLFLNFKMKDFNYFVNSLFLILLTFPVLILYEFMPSTPFIISFAAIIFHILFWLLSFVKININTSLFQINEKYALRILLFLVLIMLIPFINTFGLHINSNAFLFKDVYEIRRISAENSSRIMTYLLSWLIKVIIPVSIILSIKQKKYFITALSVLIQLYLFGTGAHKSAFFSLIIITLVFLPSFRQQVFAVLSAFIILIIFSKILFDFGGNIMPESIVVRRTFFLPAIIINDYFDFFKDNHIYLSHSILKNFIHYPFELQPEQIISVKYFNSPTGHCNSGFISDGFMNFGYLGIFLNIIGVLVVFKILEIIKIAPLYSGVLVIIIYTLISSYFLTSLLTHGIILFIILSLLFLQEKKT